MVILGLDVGTSSVKSAVLDTQTNFLPGSVARAEYALDHPTPEAAEIPPDRLWQAVSAAARQAVKLYGKSQATIEAVGLSSLTPTLVLLDKQDQPIGPFWTHLDRRSRPAARDIWKAVGEEFLGTTGNRPLPGGITVCGFRQQVNDNPALRDRMGSYLHVNGWLGFRMTGEKAFEPGNASFTGLYGTVTDRQWSDRWCQYFEVDRHWLPPIVSGDQVVGTMSIEAAEALGVRPGIPVKIGVADTSSAILAVELTPEDLLHVVGTTQVLTCIVDHPKPSAHLLTRHLGVGDRLIQVAHNPVGGVALEWIKDLCFRDQADKQFYRQTVFEAYERQTNVVFAPPFLGGDRLQIEAKHAGFGELTLTSERMDLLSALLHALVKHHRAALATLSQGRTFRRIYLTGGASEVILKIIPEYKTIKTHQFEEGSLSGIAKLFRD